MPPVFRTMICLLALALPSCAHQTYIAKPLDTALTSPKLTENSLEKPEFIAYLRKQGLSEADIPFRAWDIESLTQTALFYHTDLAVAKEKLALAEYSIEIAGLKPSLGVNGTIAHSNRANNDINPMSYGLQLDIPVETTSKRALKVEEAQHLAEVSRMDAAEIAWQLRQQLQQDLINYYAHQHQLTLLAEEVAIYQQLTDILEKRVLKGLGSNTELAQYRLMLQKNQILLRNETAKTDTLLLKLAADCGLSYAQFKTVPMAPLQEDVWNTAQEDLTADALQTEALINRIDIRRSLARYAAAESRLKLEIAKQVPDITLTPGYIFEFGDRIWSLGLGTLLNMLKQQPHLIHEAEQLRSIEAAQFEGLQASVIAQVWDAQAQYRMAKSTRVNAEDALAAQRTYFQKIQKQFDAGLVDKLALTQARLAISIADQELNQAKFEVLRKRALLENVMQRPITTKEANLNTVMQNE